MCAHREASSLSTTHASPLTSPVTDEDLDLYLGASDNFVSSYTTLNGSDLDSSSVDPALRASLGAFEGRNRLSFSHSATATSPSPTQGFQRPQLPPNIRNAAKSRHGSTVPTTDPWTPIVLSDEPMKGQSHSTGSMQRRDDKPLTDSGYASSLKSAHPTITLTSFDQDSVQYLMRNESSDRRQQHYLPEQQSASVVKPKSTKSRTTSVADLADDGPDDEVLPYCGICKSNFNTNSEYAKHMARHKKDFKCVFLKCKKTDGFATQNDLDRHIKSVHNVVDVEDNVWRCFYDGCKSAAKLWPRQDNFRAHVERMHKEADVDEYVKRSDDWLEGVEKPRRRRERELEALRQQHSDQNMGFPLDQSDNFLQLPVGTQFPYPGSDSQEPPLSHYTGTNYAQSISGDLPGGQDFVVTGMPFTSGPQFYPHSVSLSQSNHTGNHLSAQAPNGMVRSYSSRLQPPLHNMDGSDTLNPTTQPIYSWQGNNSIHPLDINMSDGQNMPIIPTDVRTMPDRNPPYSNFQPDFGTGHGEYGSSTADNSQAFSSLDNTLSYMGPEYTSLDNTQYTNGTAIANEEFPDLELSINNPPSSGTQMQPTLQIKSDDCDDVDAQQLDERLQEVLKDQSFRRKLQVLIEEHELEATGGALPRKHESGSTRMATHSSAREEVKDRPYSCEYCDKTFTKNNVRNKHVKRHLQQFFCTADGCYKTFGTKQDMQRHENKCSKQSVGWRCWSGPKSRAKHTGCHAFFENLVTFQAHHKEHWTSRRQIDEFKVEKGFHGAFWCGFCNMVVPNDTHVGCDGTPRLKYRYDHIEKHIIEGRSTDEWYELKGNGRTKAQVKKEQDEARKTSACSPNDDGDDSDDDGDTEDSPQSSMESTHSIRRPRSHTLPDTHQRLVPPPTMIPGPSRGVKRGLDDDMGVDRPRSKVPHLAHTVSAADSSQPMRHSISNGRPGIVQQSSPMLKPGRVTCCRCKSTWSSNGTLTCPKCFQPACLACKFFTSSGQPVTPVPRQQQIPRKN